MFRYLQLSFYRPLQRQIVNATPARYQHTFDIPSRFRYGNRAVIMNHNKKQKKSGFERDKSTGFDEVLQADIDKLIQKKEPETDTASGEVFNPAKPTLPEPFTEIEVTVSEISSTGDGLALSENGDHVYVVPFTVPGDKVLVKVVRHFPPLKYTMADFIKVIEPGQQRKDENIGCKYFGECSGCQLQMLSYEDQLAHKKRIVEKAYANFSGLIPEVIPAIGDTFPSPLQYGYRTKLTPHFALPGGRSRKHKESRGLTEVPPIGYTYKNQRRDLDIEDCPLGTDVIREGLKSERKRVAENIHKYKKGATILLRETTARIPMDNLNVNPAVPVNYDLQNTPEQESGDFIRVRHDYYTEEKRCVTDPNAVSVEYVDDYFFSNKAGAFFQNNNSILSGFTEYIRQHALAPPSSSSSSFTSTTAASPIKYLLDAYSGSGLFTITLSPLFKSSLGVDVAGESIVSARQNARMNRLHNTGFAAADATTLFADVPYPSDQTLLVIDPPRKGCSEDFLRQMLEYGPRRVVYVSCNVHTQARDVAVMVQGNEKLGVRYDIESIRGFDFFPQTGHVEGVAILNKVTIPKVEAKEEEKA